jgi:hypothetical protein
MTRLSLSLFAVIALASPVALLPVSATAAQDPSVSSTAVSVPGETGAEPLPSPAAFQSDQLLSQDELDELDALEAENTELQQQQAGFFGPRIGTIIIIVILLIVLL